jgi:hypothetical protein
MVLSSLRHLVVDPMSRRTRPPAQVGLWGPQEPLPTDRGPGYSPSNDLDLFVAIARTAIDPGYVLIGPTERVFHRDPSRKGHVDSVPSYEAAMVAQMIDSRHLSTGGTHHVIYRCHDGAARSVLVPRATRDQIDRWTRLRPLPRPTGAAP